MAESALPLQEAPTTGMEMRTLKMLCFPLLRLELDFRYLEPPSAPPCCIHSMEIIGAMMLSRAIFLIIGKCVCVSLSNNDQNNKLPLIVCLHQPVRLH